MLRTLCGIALFVGKYMDDYSNYRFVKKVTDLSQVQYNNHLIETVCFLTPSLSCAMKVKHKKYISLKNDSFKFFLIH